MSATRTITSIEIQKGKRNRVSIFLEGAFAFGLDQDVLIQSGIATGDQLTEEQVLAVVALEERHSANAKRCACSLCAAAAGKSSSTSCIWLNFPPLLWPGLWQRWSGCS